MGALLYFHELDASDFFCSDCVAAALMMFSRKQRRVTSALSAPRYYLKGRQRAAFAPRRHQRRGCERDMQDFAALAIDKVAPRSFEDTVHITRDADCAYFDCRSSIRWQQRHYFDQRASHLLTRLCFCFIFFLRLQASTTRTAARRRRQA